jgi:hypothetical protein
MYGKIIDGKFVLAPNPLVSDKYKIYNPKPEHYEAEGYIEVIETDYPDDGKYYEKHYIERDGKIYGEWIEAEAPEVPEAPTPTPTTDERITALEEELQATKILLGVE